MVDVDGSKELFLRAKVGPDPASGQAPFPRPRRPASVAATAGATPPRRPPPPCLDLPPPRSQSDDKTLRLVNHMWHVLVREEGNERLNEQIAEWVLERAAKPAAA